MPPTLERGKSRCAGRRYPLAAVLMMSMLYPLGAEAVAHATREHPAATSLVLDPELLGKDVAIRVAPGFARGAHRGAAKEPASDATAAQCRSRAPRTPLRTPRWRPGSRPRAVGTPRVREQSADLHRRDLAPGRDRSARR